MTDHAGPRGYECNPVFQIVTREICNLVLKFHNPMKFVEPDDKLWHPSGNFFFYDFLCGSNFYNFFSIVEKLNISTINIILTFLVNLPLVFIYKFEQR